jgi:hypothetical protein
MNMQENCAPGSAKGRVGQPPMKHCGWPSLCLIEDSITRHCARTTVDRITASTNEYDRSIRQ